MIIKVLQSFFLILTGLSSAVCLGAEPGRADFLQYDDKKDDRFFSEPIKKMPKIVPIHPREGEVQTGQQAFSDQPKAVYYPSRCVRVKGTASTEGVSEEFARQMAIRDALKNASMQNNLKVSSVQEVTDFKLSKTSERFTTQSKIQKYQIVSEGMMELNFDNQYNQYGEEIEDAAKKAKTTYEVEIDACVTENPAACNETPGNQYQLKVAISQVAMDPNQGQSVADIANLLRGYQLELDRRFSLAGHTNKVLLQSGSSLYPNLGLTPNLAPEVLEPIRDQTGAQYVLLSIIRSASRHNDDHSAWNSVKRFYEQEIKANVRYIEMDWYLVDLMNYQIKAQKRLGFDVKGDVTVGRDKPFGSSAFFDTDTGMVFHALLNQQVQGAMQELRCQPLETQIIDKREGDIVIYLAADSGAQVGDTLAVYHKFGNNIRFQGVDLGLDSEPSGFIKIKRIQNKFAIATVESQQGLMDVGDIVKAW